jgi:diphosphomevalonate decarboxylase
MFFNKHAVPEQKKGRVTWKSPSNIAILKYWGKRFEQLPVNPSLSMTLTEAYTETSVAYEYDPGREELSVEFSFEGTRDQTFTSRVKKYLERIALIYPAINNCSFTIDSSNSFPHSSGIASSASSMSALALCISSIFDDPGNDEGGYLERASCLARIGSGSASRSVLGGWALWGETPDVDGSSDEYAVSLNDMVHDDFRDMHDAILIVSSGSKEVSSTAGHKLMEKHSYREGRLSQASARLKALLGSMRYGNFEDFIRVTENEALSLHGLMMSSDPSYMLLKPATVDIIHKIRKFREQFQIPVCFTLDAGPNVHLIYPAKVVEEVTEFIKKELVPHCEKGKWIDDRIGSGPEKLKQDYA